MQVKGIDSDFAVRKEKLDDGPGRRLVIVVDLGGFDGSTDEVKSVERCRPVAAGGTRVE